MSKKPAKLEPPKKRTSKFMQVTTVRWIEVFSENLKLKEELAKLKTK